MTSILEVKNLSVYFDVNKKEIPVVKDLSFSLEKGKVLGIAGESGSGKSVTAQSILRLISSPPLIRNEGEILYNGKNILSMNINDVRTIRGNEIAYIFQEPMTALNPAYTIGNQIMETILTHQKVTKEEAFTQGVNLLKEVGISSPELRMSNYPHELSGGMRQRVMTAIALSCNPSVLIADEPTTALDVTIQAQVLQLFAKIIENRDMAMIFITHDLGVIAEIADDVLIMKNGEAVEFQNVIDLFHKPQHEYTKELLSFLKRGSTNE